MLGRSLEKPVFKMLIFGLSLLSISSSIRALQRSCSYSLSILKFPLNPQALSFWPLSPTFDGKLLAEIIMTMLLLNSVEIFILILNSS